MLFTATDPAGPWSEPIRLPGVPGIDPDLAWDDDGTCWCTVAGVEQVRIDPHTGQTFGAPRRLWSGHARRAGPGGAAPVPDRRLLVPADRRGRHRARPRRLDRPRPGARRAVRAVPGQPDPDPPRHRPPDPEHRPRRPRRRRPTARGGWCCSAYGRGGGTPGWHVLGRETFLAPVDLGRRLAGRRRASHRSWRRPPWPPHPVAAPPVRDDFDADRAAPALDLAAFPARRALVADQGPAGLAHPARPRRVARRPRRHVRRPPPAAPVLPGADAGRRRRGARRARGAPRRAAPLRDRGRRRRGAGAWPGSGSLRTTVATRPAPAGPVRAADRRASPRRPATGIRARSPTCCASASRSRTARSTCSAELDGRYLSTEVAGGFTGRVIGMYAAAGTVHFDWFDYEPSIRLDRLSLRRERRPWRPSQRRRGAMPAPTVRREPGCHTPSGRAVADRDTREATRPRR